ncbi:OprD family porin [Pseudomonas sp. ZM23]|uniref:OprD family porin n=1 Tax=Pseudomonas triclosanedens TaxID=2961893 RepID=A0ABY6ZT03_9PSED|nr:OprD family porin [Pseudomonas triclosanedens]MCP8467026.1 OprD family porin [Pseudomonas triclosanedens]MCP8472826.1 OprD family porin [Pseudomonas triclosanedens]MCP8478257.1 OprD family porin [Pseudomonas triclosanedens]WAI47662.1 OprD family porin [Pseudomonas triclosanedens]
MSSRLSSRSPRPLCGLGALALLGGIAPPASADFLEDSSARLEARTLYFNRDFRDGSSSNPQGASKREETAQGFILNVQSGYTEGTVGFGVDALAMLGVKLDSSPADSNSGLLPSSGHDPRGSAGQYAKAGVTGKLRVSRTQLKYGAMLPDMPLLKYNDGRLLPNMFHGALLSSEELRDLKFTATHLSRYTARDSSDAQDLRLNCKNKRYTCDTTGGHFESYQLDYKVNDQWLLQYAQGGLENVYRQRFAGVVGKQAIGEGTASADLRWFDSDDDGNARAGNIDNRALSLLLAYAQRGHVVSAGWQRMSGDTSMPYLDGSNPYLANYVQVNDFANAEERSWQLRYDYDLRYAGIPGLSFMTRYVNGDHIRLANGDEGKEWERDVEFKYVVQAGAFKDLSLRLRNATYRTNYEQSARDVDEVRLIASYSFSVL